MVLHFRDGAQAFVNDIQMGISLVKQLQSRSYEKAAPSSTSSAQSTLPLIESCAKTSQYDDSMEVKLHYDRAALLRYSSPPGVKPNQATLPRYSCPPGLKCSIKNTFIHVDTDEETGECSDGALSAPASFEDFESKREFYMGEQKFDIAMQTELSETPKVPMQDVATETSLDTDCYCSNNSMADARNQTEEDIMETASRDAQSLNSLVGSWTALGRPTSGTIVRAQQAFLSGEQVPIKFREGVIGSNSKIDGEGDAAVYSPGLANEGARDSFTTCRWRCYHCWTHLENDTAICRYCKDKTVAVAYDVKKPDAIMEKNQEKVV